MSLKQDVEYIKKEFSAEESYMEKVFKFEKFFKKYKMIIIALIIALVVATITYYVSDHFEQKNKLQANKAFNTLLKDPNNKEALAILEVKNPTLYKIFQFNLNDETNTDVEFFKELALYAQAINKESIADLTTVTQQQSFVLKDFALFNKALIQAQNDNFLEAKETLKLIDSQSEVSPMAKMLEHFLLTK